MRTTWGGVPDRGGHAFNADGSANTGSVDQPAVERSTVLREEVPEGPIQGAERYYKMEAGERLYQVSQRHGISLYWLIKRNDLGDLPYAGQKLIVPGPAYQ